MNQYYESYLARKRKEYGARFNPGALAPQFIEYLHSDVRIKVRSPHGYERTGTVGITTGWMPAFLLMHRSSSHGSSDVLSHEDQIIAVQQRGRYVPI